MFGPDSQWYFDDLDLVSLQSQLHIRRPNIEILNLRTWLTYGTCSNTPTTNCVFNTIYPDLASTSPTLAAVCANATAGNTYIHALTTPTGKKAPLFASTQESSNCRVETSATAPTSPTGPNGTSGTGSHGLSKGDVIALAVGLGIGIPTLIVMICAWLCPCTPWIGFNRRRRGYRL
jgi:hypothetical protein